MVRGCALVLLVMLLTARPAGAVKLRVLAPSELRMEPRVHSDRTSLMVTVRVRDDRGAPARGRVHVEAFPEAGPLRWTFEAETDERGEVQGVVPLTPSDRAFRIRARFQGSNGAAPAVREDRVDLDLPFLTLDLHAPATVDLGRAFVDVVVSINVGAVVVRSPGNLEVALLVDGERIASARSDSTGRALFRVPVTRLGAPGVRTLRAELAVSGHTRSSPQRRVVVRTHTALTLESSRVGEADARLVGALMSGAGPVAGAPIRIVSRGRVIAGGLTDQRGTFSVALDPELLTQPDLRVRAYFDPGEPWYLPAESAEVAVTPPAPRTISWKLVAVPVLAAVGWFLLVWMVQRKACTSVVSSSAHTTADLEVRWSKEGTADGVVRIKLVVVDRSTGNEVPDALARWKEPEEGCRPAREAVEVSGQGHYSVEISADGYAPRMFAGPLPRRGEVVLRVALRGWREELFDRLRRWMHQVGTIGAPVLPTPREALALRASKPTEETFVLFVEGGVYGPKPPDAVMVQQADALATAAASASTDRVKR